MKSLYNLRSVNDPTFPPRFTITKFDSDLNPESTYEVDAIVCTCPQGHKPTCRHRKMLPLFLDSPIPRLDTAWFLDYDTRMWHDPTGEAGIVEDERVRSNVKVVGSTTGRLPAHQHDPVHPSSTPPELAPEPASAPAPSPPTIRRRV